MMPGGACPGHLQRPDEPDTTPSRGSVLHRPRCCSPCVLTEVSLRSCPRESPKAWHRRRRAPARGTRAAERCLKRRTASQHPQRAWIRIYMACNGGEARVPHSAGEGQHRLCQQHLQ